MTGLEYMQYRERNKLKLTKNQKVGWSIIIGTIIIGIILFGLIHSYFNPIMSFQDKIPFLIALKWGTLLKLGLIVAFPVIMLSWVFHGVQLRLLA